MKPKEYNTVAGLLEYGTTYLKTHNVENALRESKILLKHLGFDDMDLIINNKLIIDDTIEKYISMLNKRTNGEPIQYITNTCPFWDLNFYVDKRVLIPRPETELLVEIAIKIIKENNFKQILEIGTGTGCICISLAHTLNISVTSADKSQDALDVAKINAKSNNVNINFCLSDLYENVPQTQFDVIISNPPYIKTDIINTLDINVKDYEPHMALDGGADGLDFYRNIIKDAKYFLKPNGMIFFEIGFDQGDTIKKLLEENSFVDINIIKDYAKQDRIAIARRLEIQNV